MLLKIQVTLIDRFKLFHFSFSLAKYYIYLLKEIKKAKSIDILDDERAAINRALSEGIHIYEPFSKSLHFFVVGGCGQFGFEIHFVLICCVNEVESKLHQVKTEMQFFKYFLWPKMYNLTGT